MDIDSHWPTEGWRTAEAEALGMDPKAFAGFRKAVGGERRIISACVAKHGHLAYQYFRDGADDLQMIYSITKSIVSLLVGIAIGEGKLRAADQPVADFFPELSGPRVDPRLRRMTLADLLTMRSGVEPVNHLTCFSPTWGEYVAAQKPIDEPGRTYRYSAFDAQLLAVILQQATGEDLLAYARARLFGPLGITEVGWPVDNTGVRIGSHGMMLRTLDMAKIGHLLLRGGRWDGAQVVPEAWVAESTKAHVADSDRLSRYGYLWWLHAKAKCGRDSTKSGNFFALGANGQCLYVAPVADAVAVVTSYLPEEPIIPMDIIDRHLLPALRQGPS